MEISSFIEVWKWFTWLPKVLLKKVFTKKRLSELLYIDIRPRHESFRVSLSDVSTYDVYFQIINMTPFEVEMDTAEFDFNIAGIGLKHQYIKKYRLKAGQIGDLLITGKIDYHLATLISGLKENNASSVTIYCSFNCSLHEFEKDNLHLSGINPRYIDSILKVEG